MAVVILLRFQKERPAAIVWAAIQRTPGADTATPTRRPCSSPADLFGTRGSLMSFITTMMVAELRADHARTGLRAALDMACKDSRNDAFGGIAGTVPCNRFDF
jgi:hypothetical protein